LATHYNFVKQHSVAGRMSPIVQIEPLNMKIRHDELAEEMIRRGYNHNSPYELPDLSYLPEHLLNASVDIDNNIIDLCNRCKECYYRIRSKQYDTKKSLERVSNSMG
jgi:hypothetical protein